MIKEFLKSTKHLLFVYMPNRQKVRDLLDESDENLNEMRTMLQYGFVDQARWDSLVNRNDEIYKETGPLLYPDGERD